MRAQSEPQLSPSLRAAVLDAPGVVRAEGKILGIGPGYRAWFDAQGVAFGAPGRDPMLRFGLASVGRTDGAVHGLDPVEPDIDGDTVRYGRGLLVERYEMRPDGVEQSFLFTELPQGRGDLVMQLRADTNLAPVDGGEPSADLVLTSTDGGMAINAVVGIDAGGRRCPGAMRFRSGQWEIVLPESFVAGATLPLLVDPLIGTPFSTGWQGGAGGGISSDVAYDATNDVFLVGWTEFQSGPVLSLGRLVRPSGTLVGPLLCLECDSSYSGLLQSIANVNARDRFVVWFPNYFPVTVSASTGEVRIQTALGRSFGLYTDLGGEATTLDDDLVLVWTSLPTIRAYEYQVDSSGDLVLLGSAQLGSTSLSPSLAQPSISKSGGASGRHLIVWNGDSKTIHGAIIDRNLNVLDSGVLWQSAEDKFLPLVDGNGRQWVVACRAASGAKCVPVFWEDATQTAWVGAEARLSPTFSGFVNVGMLDSSCLIHYDDPGGPAGFVMTVDPFTCLPCERSVRMMASIPLACRIASRRSGDLTGDDLALLTQQVGVSQFFRADDGIVTDLGGGCGQGGWSAATCARVGNDGFTVRLREARVGVPAFLVLGTQTVSFPCGSCTLVPSPLAVLGAGLTDVHGNAAVLLPVPNQPSLLNQTFLEQWLTVGGTACAFGVEMSNALQVRLQ